MASSCARCLRTSETGYQTRGDKSHKVLTYNLGNEIRLSSKFFDFVGLQNKLKPAWIGPFKGLSMKGSNVVEVELPLQCRPRKPTFPISLTELQRHSPEHFSARREHQPQYPVVEQDDEGQDFWELDCIRRQRTRRSADGPMKGYLLHWKGWDVSYDSWVPKRDFHADDALRGLRSRNKSRSR